MGDMVINPEKEVLVDLETFKRFQAELNGPSVFRRGLFEAQPDNDGERILIKLLPSAVAIIPYDGGNSLTVLMNTDLPSDYLICPRCLVHWRKRGQGLPQMCPMCHQTFFDLPEEEFRLDLVIERVRNEVITVGPEDQYWSHHAKSRDVRWERVDQLLRQFRNELAHKTPSHESNQTGGEGEVQLPNVVPRLNDWLRR